MEILACRVSKLEKVKNIIKQRINLKNIIVRHQKQRVTENKSGNKNAKE